MLALLLLLLLLLFIHFSTVIHTFQRAYNKIQMIKREHLKTILKNYYD